jgi:hypothetical protein
VASWEHVLAAPPADDRRQALWLQHAVGFVLAEDVRGYAGARGISAMFLSSKIPPPAAADGYRLTCPGG